MYFDCSTWNIECLSLLYNVNTTILYTIQYGMLPQQLLSKCAIYYKVLLYHAAIGINMLRFLVAGVLCYFMVQAQHVPYWVMIAYEQCEMSALSPFQHRTEVTLSIDHFCAMVRIYMLIKIVYRAIVYKLCNIGTVIWEL